MPEVYVRTAKSPLMQSMIDAVRNALGPYDDATLIRTIGYCRTPESAVKRCSAVLDLLPANAVATILDDEQLTVVRADEQSQDEAAEAEVLDALAQMREDRPEAFAPTGSIAGDLRQLEQMASLQLQASLPAGKPRRRKVADVMVTYSQFCHCAKPKLTDGVCRCGTAWIEQ